MMFQTQATLPNKENNLRNYLKTKNKYEITRRLNICKKA
jgi:hypothetical protein